MEQPMTAKGKFSLIFDGFRYLLLWTLLRRAFSVRGRNMYTDMYKVEISAISSEIIYTIF